MSPPVNDRPMGLRERKKARTRASIQDAALRLYLEQGYEATTVEQIAEAAEVSQSTFFRYYPTKAETVLYDRFDPVIMDSFIRQPAELSPLAAIRAAIHEVLGQFQPEAFQLEQARWRLVAQVPELRAQLAGRLEADSRLFATAVAQRTGREPDDFDVLVFTGALIGAVVGAFLTVLDDPDADLLEQIDACVAYLEAGMPL